MRDSLSLRMAHQAFQFWLGDHKNPLSWLESIGCRIEPIGPRDLVIIGPSTIRCGLPYWTGDPVAVAVQFGFAMAGGYWPEVYPGMLPEVNRLWRLLAG